MELQLQGLEARYPAARAGAAAPLQQIDLHVASGEQVAVIGASGAGKTTLLQAMGLALRPSRGTLQVGGEQPWSLRAGELQRLRGRLFLAPQVPPLPPRQRVVTAVLAGRLPAMSLGASLRSLFHPLDIPAAHDALARFDLADKLFERVDRLSGGERQRVALARALLAPARLWLVDEPLSALDPARARQALQALVNAARERGITLVASLHQVDIALAHFPRIVGLHRGRVAFDRPAAEVTRDQLAELYGAQALARVRSDDAGWPGAEGGESPWPGSPGGEAGFAAGAEAGVATGAAAGIATGTPEMPAAGRLPPPRIASHCR